MKTDIQTDCIFVCRQNEASLPHGHLFTNSISNVKESEQVGLNYPEQLDLSRTKTKLKKFFPKMGPTGNRARARSTLYFKYLPKASATNI